MKKTLRIYLFLALIIALGACSEPVFYMISVEPPIAEPLIGGSPTNFSVFNKKVYVASGRNIYSYDGTSFEKIPSQPGGRILQLAATGSYLYALCLQDSEGKIYLKRTSSSGDWEDVTGETGGYNMLQSVYAAEDRVFIGAERNGNFIILHMTDNDAAYSPLTTGGTNDKPESMLCGIAYDSQYYYLCTRSNKIFLMPITGGPVTANSKMKDDDAQKEDDNVKFTGIINLGNNTILAISRNGNLYNINADTDITRLQNISIGSSRYSTGSLAIWRDETDTPKLLLAGRQDSLVYAVDSGYTYGYMELELDSGGINGIKADTNFKVPGTFPSSVADYERYVSTIGKYPLGHIFQTPADIDPNMTLFASTQKNGVWSYKERDGIFQWNAEE
jgi:hypothetical protein